MATMSFFQNRLGRTDGVSLEVDKWRAILRDRLGHQVRYCSGNDDVAGNDHLPELYAQHPRTWKILRNGTVAMTDDYAREEDLELEIYNHADVIEAKLLQFITEKKVDVLIPNNLCSGGYQPAAAIAFHRVIQRTGKPAIIHSHDFYFEDSGEVSATCQTVASIYERYFPPKLPNVRHVVINRIAQRRIKERKNIDARVVPNVFDFRQEPWRQDDYNADFREAFGIGADDLLALQATRILDRKGVEMAIDLVAKLGEPQRRRALSGMKTAVGGRVGESSRIVLLCAGIVETIGISGDYWNALKDHARELGVEMIHVGDRVAHSRGRDDGGRKIYSLWDSYVQADFVTYPSTWEGWGNQFIEAVFARLPVVVFEYPVWRSDLGPAGFDVISLGGEVDRRDSRGLAHVAGSVLERAADQTVAVLTDPDRRERMAEANYRIGLERFSMETLEGIIRELLGEAGIG
ncbi:MAG: glycosyltransferase family 4 protein [Phycisphaeraceae bacterium]|nr:glycosyltransferase family 4 protein [Phycisphaeraceae bacterium]